MTMLGYRTGRTGEVFASLVSTALGQKITGTNARRSLFGIAYRWGERAPGPRDDLRLLPPPRELERRPWYAPMPPPANTATVSPSVSPQRGLNRCEAWVARKLFFPQQKGRPSRHVPGVIFPLFSSHQTNGERLARV